MNTPTTETIYEQLGISKEVWAFGQKTEEKLKERFEEFDRNAEYNQLKVIHAMQENRVSEGCFNYVSGYGYNDQGRDTLEDVYASVFHTEAALVRPQITCGTHALALALAANLRPGDTLLSPVGKPYDTLEEVIGIRPSRGSLAEYGVTYRQVDLKEDGTFDYDAIRAAINEKTKAILLNYPSNPTGGFMTKEDYEKLVPIFKESGIMIITDEIYAELSYEHKFCSIASFDEIKDQVILVSGFSKAYAMTGWRLGYVLANEYLIKMMKKIHQYVIMSAPTCAQYGAIEAMRHCDEEIEKMRQAYLARRNFLVKTFNEMGLKTFTPQGAFYVFPCIKSTGLTSEQFCEELLNDQLVACVPGSAFGEAGEGYIRVSYAYSLEELKAATKKIRKFLEKKGVK